MVKLCQCLALYGLSYCVVYPLLRNLRNNLKSHVTRLAQLCFFHLGNISLIICNDLQSYSCLCHFLLGLLYCCVYLPWPKHDHTVLHGGVPDFAIPKSCSMIISPIFLLPFTDSLSILGLILKMLS